LDKEIKNKNKQAEYFSFYHGFDVKIAPQGIV
jgi:hypothetical protein